MNSEPPIVELRLCPQCGAACAVTQPVCWMCTGQLPPVQSGSAAPATGRPDGNSSALDPLFYFLLACCLGLTLLVGIGIAAQDPGALVGFAVVVAPAFAVTGVRALWQVQETGKAQPGKLLVSFVVSFVFTIAVLVILAVAAVVLLFVTCLNALSGS